MFKLIKILGAGNNVPEPIKFPIDGTRAYDKGFIFFIIDGVLTTRSTDKTNRKVILLESIPANSGRDFVWGYYVTDNMVFEVDLCWPDYFPVGSCLSFHEDDVDLGIDNLDNCPGEDALVIEDNHSDHTGKVIVTLKW